MTQLSSDPDCSGHAFPTVFRSSCLLILSFNFSSSCLSYLSLMPFNHFPITFLSLGCRSSLWLYCLWTPKLIKKEETHWIRRKEQLALYPVSQVSLGAEGQFIVQPVHWNNLFQSVIYELLFMNCHPFFKWVLGGKNEYLETCFWPLLAWFQSLHPCDIFVYYS